MAKGTIFNDILVICVATYYYLNSESLDMDEED
jgi:hypothetical protein